MRGRKPKPTTLKLLEGNPGKRRLDPAGEPAPAAGIPACPDWLDPVARARYAELAPELARLGILTVVDGDALAAYCQAWAEFRRATELLAKEGRILQVGTQKQPHPAATQQRSALKALKDFAALLGLDPSSRGRLKVTPPAAEDKGVSGFARKRSG